MARLGDVCTVSASSKPVHGDKVWLLNLDMIEQQTGNILDYNYVPVSELDGSIIRFDTENILYSKLRPNLNKVVLPEKSGFSTSELLPLKPDQSLICKEYLVAYLRSSSFVSWAVSKTAGAKMPRLGTKELLNKEIPLPQLDTQHHIAAVLDKVSDLIALRKRQLAKLDELVKARFVEMFGDMILNPNSWDKVFLGSVCDVRDGTHDSPKYFNEGYPLVTSKNVTSGKIDFNNCSLICEEDYKKINERSKVDAGDILMPMIGTVGRPVIVDIDADFAIKNVALIKFYKDSKVINTFVKLLLQSDYFDRAVMTKIKGGTQKFIALGDIRNLEICLPPMAIQLHFQMFVEQVEKTKSSVQKALAETQVLFDSLMQEYFG